MISKKNATLKTVYEPEEEITLQTLEKDIERQTNFNNLGYNPEQRHQSMGEALADKSSKFKKTIKKIHNNQGHVTKNTFSRYSNVTNNLSNLPSFEQSFSKETQKLGKLFEITRLEKMGMGKNGSKILPKIKNSSMSKIHNFVHAV